MRLSDSRSSRPSNRGKTLSFLTRKVHLPAAPVRCSISLAYQAADAGHPESGRASSLRSKGTAPTGLFHTRLEAAKAHVGRASPEKSIGRPASILIIGRSCSGARVCLAAKSVFPKAGLPGHHRQNWRDRPNRVLSESGSSTGGRSSHWRRPVLDSGVEMAAQ